MNRTKRELPIVSRPTRELRTILRNVLIDWQGVCIYMRMDRDSKKIVKRLQDEGFELVRIAGSHHKFRKGGTVVIVPHPKRDLPTGTARAIAKQAGRI